MIKNELIIKVLLYYPLLVSRLFLPLFRFSECFPNTHYFENWDPC